VTAFVDTSFLIALLDEDDARASRAAEAWRRAAHSEALVVTSNYVVLETCAVLQRRLGIAAVRRLVRDVLAPVSVEWVSREDHELAADALLLADRRGLSLVDCTSFELMRRLGLRECLAFDAHFGEQGFLGATV
jgi:uncharacterized protein